MYFSCNNILIFNFKKCRNFPLGPLKKYLSAWLYDSTLSTKNSVIYPPMVLSNQWSSALDTTLSSLLTFLINIDVQTTDGLDLISNWIYSNLDNHLYSSLWIPPKKILCISIKIYLPNQSSVLRLGFLLGIQWSPFIDLLSTLNLCLRWKPPWNSVKNIPIVAIEPFVGIRAHLGFNSKSAPTSPNCWPFRQHLQGRCSVTRSSMGGCRKQSSTTKGIPSGSDIRTT